MVWLVRKSVGQERVRCLLILNKTYRLQNVLLQNVLETKRIGGQNVSATKRIGDIMYLLQNVSAGKTYWRTKCIGEQNVLETKRIGGQNVSADKTYRRTKHIGGQNVLADHKTFEIIFKKHFHHFYGTNSVNFFLTKLIANLYSLLTIQALNKTNNRCLTFTKITKLTN